MKLRVRISCQEVWREISDYLDGDIDADLRQEMERHFEHCRHCSALLDGTRNVIVLSADERTYTLPANFSQRLYKKLQEYLRTTATKA